MNGLKRTLYLPDSVKADKQTGNLQLVCAKKGEKTVLQDAYFDGALKLTRPVYLDNNGSACLYIMNTGGGMVNGDQYRMEFVLEEKAEAVITTQASTKIYKTLTQPAKQKIDIHLKRGSTLEYLPDPIIAYQDARFEQHAVIRIEKDAAFICTDIFTPGWAPDGTLFRYDLLQSRMDIYQNERLILFDHIKLEPDEGVNGIGYMEGYTHFGTMVVIHKQFKRPLLDELHECLQPFTEARIGLSLLSVPGVALRVLAHSTQEVSKIVRCCLEQIKTHIFQQPISFLRKY